MCSEDLQARLLLVGGGDDKGRLALGVGLVHTGASLQQVLNELLAAVTRGIVQAAVALRVHGEGVRPVVQQQLDDCDPVRADGITQRRDALAVMRVQRLLLGQEVLHGLEVAVLRGLMQCQRCLIDLLQHGLQLCRQAAHLLAKLQHQLLVLQVLHGRLHAVFLDVLHDGAQLRVQLHGLHAILHRSIAAFQLGAVVLGHGLRLQVAPHGFRVLGEALQRLRLLRVALQELLHLGPSRVVDVRQARDLHGIRTDTDCDRLGRHECRGL
mmetsp:Transcript_71929/g.203130  ORF Transcript_71929/g.203130 Transcript_71929/m.203130 type:complete len:268 (+) Transcript_71929:272-1075(+)